MVVALDTSSAAIATSAGFTVSVAVAAKAVEVMARDPVVEMVVVNAVVTRPTQPLPSRESCDCRECKIPSHDSVRRKGGDYGGGDGGGVVEFRI